MIIKINYNKTTGVITASNDVPECAIVVNENGTVDNAQELNVEIALNTSYLMEIQSDIPDGSIN